MPKKRPIPAIDVKDYAQVGPIYFKPYSAQVAIELHFCTALMEKDQALQATISLLKACRATWGDAFMADIKTIVEGL